MKVIWSPTADRNLDAIWEYIAQDNLDAADRMAEQLEYACWPTSRNLESLAAPTGHENFQSPAHPTFSSIA